jgi:protein involved in polysaccharide export with SLBB domain
MKVGEIRATGLTAGEIQDALEHAKIAKAKPYEQFLKETQSLIIELSVLDPQFAKGIIEAIKKHHPNLLKEI